MVVRICTTNADKAALLRTCLAELALDSRLEARALDEPQADTIAEVARAKAAQAFAWHGGPVIVEDSGLAIDGLGGFPGPYTKFALATIGARGLVALAAGKPCRFTSVTAVARGSGEIVVGEHAMAGTIARDVAAGCDGSWSDLWRVFIAAGGASAFSELAAADRTAHLDAWRAQLVTWLRGALLG